MPTEFRDDLSVEYVRSRLDYDHVTGILRWRHNPTAPTEWNVRRAGKLAGYTQKGHGGHFYITVRIDGKLYMAHRLAWAIHYGEWPSRGLDHENRDQTANWIDNLRLSTQAENTLNRSAQRNSKSGIKGIGRHGLRWRVRIQGHGQALVQSFSTLEEAKAWHAKMARAIHGDFAPKPKEPPDAAQEASAACPA